MNALLSQVSHWNRKRLERRHTRLRRAELAQDPTLAYRRWIDRFDTLTPTVIESFRLRERELERRPLISVIMRASNPVLAHLMAAVESVQQQIYGEWELCIAHDSHALAPQASGEPNTQTVDWLQQLARSDPRVRIAVGNDLANAALASASGEYIALLEQHDLLRPHSLLIAAEALNRFSHASILYSDEDRIDESGARCNHYFKTDWNPFLFRSHNVLSHLGIYRRELVMRAGGYREGFDGAQDYDLALRCSEHASTREIIHLPFVLYHSRTQSGDPAHAPSQPQSVSGDPTHGALRETTPLAVASAERALQEHLKRLGLRADVLATSCGYRVRYAPAVPEPRVTIIVPTRDRADLLQQCIDSVLLKTVYGNYEILVVDNGSTDPEALAYLSDISDEPRVRVISDPGDPGEFNYSYLNNFAVSQTDAEFICLLNNDIEVITPRWLTEMVSLARLPGTGAVGAKLLYPSGELQHAGVIVGLCGVAAHAHKNFSTNHPGYTGRACLVQEMSAVTGACMVLRRQSYLDVGGLDEKHLAVEFNDVDLCLKLLKRGYRNVWTPYARLYHHESVSRGSNDNPAKTARSLKEAEYIRYRWADVIRHDPAYNPNLTVVDGTFTLAFPPRVSLTDPYWFKHLEYRHAA